jgi:hypothetical protein
MIRKKATNFAVGWEVRVKQANVGSQVARPESKPGADGMHSRRAPHQFEQQSSLVECNPAAVIWY